MHLEKTTKCSWITWIKKEIHDGNVWNTWKQTTRAILHVRFVGRDGSRTQRKPPPAMCLFKKQERWKVNEFLASLENPGEEHQGRKKEIRKMSAEINGTANVLQKIKPKHDSGKKWWNRQASNQEKRYNKAWNYKKKKKSRKTPMNNFKTINTWTIFYKSIHYESRERNRKLE